MKDKSNSWRQNGNQKQDLQKMSLKITREGEKNSNLLYIYKQKNTKTSNSSTNKQLEILNRLVTKSKLKNSQLSKAQLILRDRSKLDLKQKLKDLSTSSKILKKREEES